MCRSDTAADGTTTPCTSPSTAPCAADGSSLSSTRGVGGRSARFCLCRHDGSRRCFRALPSSVPEGEKERKREREKESVKVLRAWPPCVSYGVNVLRR